MKKLVIPAMLIGSLAACSGASSNGGFSSTATAFTSFSDVNPGDTIKATGKAYKVSVTRDAGTGAVTSVNVTPTEQTATLTFTTDPSTNEVTSATISTAGLTVTGDNSSAFVGATGPNNLQIVEATDGSILLIQADPTTSGFNYQSYILWASGLETGSTAATGAVGTFGAVTPLSGMPTVNATYTGTSTGILANPTTGDSGALTSNVNVAITNSFNDVTLTSAGTVGIDTSTGAPIPSSTFDASGFDFVATGTVSGTGFNATVSSSTNLDTGGTVNGQFYGPNGEEVGGTFSTTGTAGGWTYVGAFGAVK